MMHRFDFLVSNQIMVQVGHVGDNPRLCRIWPDDFSNSQRKNSSFNINNTILECSLHHGIRKPGNSFPSPVFSESSLSGGKSTPRVSNKSDNSRFLIPKYTEFSAE